MATRCLLRTAPFLLLLSSSSAWASDGSRHSRRLREAEAVPRRDALEERVSEPESLPPWTGLLGAEGVEVVEKQVDYVVVRIREEVYGRGQQQQQQQQQQGVLLPNAAPQLPRVTPPPDPELVRRQDDNGQVSALSSQLQSISDASRQVSQASQQLSQSSQQLSQSLQQAQQQLSETERQLSSARSDADSNRQNAEAASRSADQAVSQASRSLSSNMASITSSAGASAASMISAASRSAESIMNNAASMVQQAQADATSVRADADTRILQAQGAAVSVTQAALAIVGAMIGSSLLTILAFVLISRYRRRRKQRRGTVRGGGGGGGGPGGGISYPALNGSSSGAKAYDAGAYETGVGFSFPADVKEPQPAALPGGVMVGVARGGDPRSSISTDMTPDINSNNAAAANYATPGRFQLQSPPKGKFSLFPRNREEAEQQQKQKQQQTIMSGGSAPLNNGSDVGDDDASNYDDGPGQAAGVQQQQQQQQQQETWRDSRVMPPTLETWLKASTVSPFGTLNKNNTPSPEAARRAKKAPNWPLGRAAT